MKYFHEKKIEAQRAAKASDLHQKRITGFIAKMIKTFWNNVEKVSNLYSLKYMFSLIYNVKYVVYIAACLQTIN